MVDKFLQEEATRLSNTAKEASAAAEQLKPTVPKLDLTPSDMLANFLGSLRADIDALTVRVDDLQAAIEKMRP